MGAADTVPGVSGGTIALITGIYEDLLAAIKSADTRMLQRLSALDVKDALAGLHMRFLLCLFCGIGIAVISLARLMSYLIHYHPVQTWSLFFGLIAASIWAVGRKVENWTLSTGAGFCIGAIAAYFIVGLVPAATPETLGFVFISGMLAVCAMILPGISGAFILLILGKYEFIIATLENPFLSEHMMIIVVFVGGCAIGLIGFARVLKFLLDRYHNMAIAGLTGLMLGSMRKIWPWKEPVIVEKIHGEWMVLKEKNVFPDMVPSELAAPVLLMAVGFAVVFILDRLSKKAPAE